MNYQQMHKEVAQAVNTFVNMPDDKRPPLSELTRELRLKYGIGERTVNNILENDYPYFEAK